MFAVKRGEIGKRADVLFNLPQAKKGDAQNRVLLGSLCLREPDYGVSATAIERTDESQPKYIRITDFSDNGIGDGHTFTTVAEYLPKHILNDGDILFARSGSIGRTYQYDESLGLAVFAGYCIRFALDPEKAFPEYVYWYTKTQMYADWVKKIKRPTVQPNINKEEYKSLEIILPSRNKQKRLAAKMSAAAQQRAAKLRKINELTAGMDEFVRKTTGLPEEDKTRPMLFATKITINESMRFDPEFHNPFYQHRIQRIKEMNHDTLGNIVEFSNETWNQSDDFDDTFPYIEISGVGIKTNEYEVTKTPVSEAPSRAKMIVRDGDIIISTTRPHRGAIATISCGNGYCIASTGFCVLRKMKREDVSREYLQWILLNDYVLQQFLQRSSGGNYPAIIQSEMEKVVIPIPDKSVQNEIAVEAIRRKKATQELKKMAEAEWTAAKERFERELLD